MQRVVPRNWCGAVTIGSAGFLLHYINSLIWFATLKKDLHHNKSDTFTEISVRSQKLCTQYFYREEPTQQPWEKKNYYNISNISCLGRRMSKKWNQRLYRKYAKSLHFPYSVTVSMTACLWISCLSTVYSKAICRFIVYNDIWYTKFKYTHRSLVFW